MVAFSSPAEALHTAEMEASQKKGFSLLFVFFFFLYSFVYPKKTDNVLSALF